MAADIIAANDRLADLDANITEWQEILDLAVSLATRCGDAYRKASDAPVSSSTPPSSSAST
jgi:hypothetical protein